MLCQAFLIAANSTQMYEQMDAKSSDEVVFSCMLGLKFRLVILIEVSLKNKACRFPRVDLAECLCVFL